MACREFSASSRATWTDMVTVSDPNFFFTVTGVTIYKLRYGHTPSLALLCLYFYTRGKGHFTRSSFRRWIPFSLGNVWNVASSWKWWVNRLSFPQLQDSMGILYTLVHGTEIRAETVHKGSPGRVRQSWVKCQRAHVISVTAAFTALLYSLIARAQWQLNDISQQKHSRWCFLQAQWWKPNQANQQAEIHSEGESVKSPVVLQWWSRVQPAPTHSWISLILKCQVI